MSQDESVVIVMTGATANSHRVYHRELPEVRAEGETPTIAATHLVNHLTRALDSALTDWRRQTLNQAIDDVKKFVAAGESTHSV
jgi:hypothetical protein